VGQQFVIEEFPFLQRNILFFFSKHSPFWRRSAGLYTTCNRLLHKGFILVHIKCTGAITAPQSPKFVKHQTCSFMLLKVITSCCSQSAFGHERALQWSNLIVKSRGKQAISFLWTTQQHQTKQFPCCWKSLINPFFAFLFWKAFWSSHIVKSRDWGAS